MVKKYPEHVSIREAYLILKENFKKLGKSEICEVEIEMSLGQTLASDVLAKRNVPHYPASAMDGYALISSSTTGATRATPIKLQKNQYFWVNTGSNIPLWADSVLMVEDSSLVVEDLLVYKALTPSTNVRPLGEDVIAGQIIARKNDVVTPALISLFICAGIEEITIYKKPKIIFVPTGNEIVSTKDWLSSKTPRLGTVVESNSLFVKATFKKWGHEIDVSSIIPDDIETLQNKIMDLVNDYDLILIGAGSAKGNKDYTFEVFDNLGEILFRWLRMKPGRPAIAAKISNKPVICLPGFPMSTAVVLWSLVFPLLNNFYSQGVDLQQLFKIAIGSNETLDAKLLVPYSSQSGIEEWLRVKLAVVENIVYAWVLTSGASVLSSLADADGIALLPSSALEYEKGSDISVWLTRSVDLEKRILFQGSDDPAIQLLATPINERGGEFVSRAVGSMGGLASLGRDECHLAAAHLLNEADGTYNDIFIRRFSNGKKWKRILVFYRTQGIIVQAGNPKNILTIEDLFNKDLVFSNRQPGAGTRVLFDHYLKKHHKNPSEVKGYDQHCTTHMEAANRVFSGLADATLGIKAVADALKLDFIPLAEEPYELVIPEKYLNHIGIIALLKSLEDKEWRKKVEKMGGYRWPEQ
ncbi:MAG: molybdopterin biosynthesis protein [Synergistaceae bacterium]|nr:molybdopterin biosynthesis protein [Synergistaceae bacterium]